MTASSGAWAWSPATLKPTADKEMAMGLNRFVIHTSVHQPLLDKKPGLALGPFGQWFTRNETWAEEAAPWLRYLARSCYLLQQGHFAADIVYYYGEDTNLTALFGKKGPDIPDGYNFDYINADALIHKLSVIDGRLTTESGMRYWVLALDPHGQHMSLPVLRKIRDLARSGAVVAGPKPTDTPSLSDDPNEFQRIADEMWRSATGEHSYGKGKVYADPISADLMRAIQVLPDFEYTKPKGDTELLFVHRNLSDGDLYYIDNRQDRKKTWMQPFASPEKKQNSGTPILARWSPHPSESLRAKRRYHSIWSPGVRSLLSSGKLRTVPREACPSLWIARLQVSKALGT